MIVDASDSSVSEFEFTRLYIDLYGCTNENRGRDSLTQSDSDLHAVTQEQACTGVSLPALTASTNVETAINNREALEFI